MNIPLEFFHMYAEQIHWEIGREMRTVKLFLQEVDEEKGKKKRKSLFFLNIYVTLTARGERNE